jgi:hypothetical protein
VASVSKKRLSPKVNSKKKTRQKIKEFYAKKLYDIQKPKSSSPLKNQYEKMFKIIPQTILSWLIKSIN